MALNGRNPSTLNPANSANPQLGVLPREVGACLLHRSYMNWRRSNLSSLLYRTCMNLLRSDYTCLLNRSNM